LILEDCADITGSLYIYNASLSYATLAKNVSFSKELIYADLLIVGGMMGLLEIK